MIQTPFPENKQAILWRAEPSANTWNLLNTFLQCYSSSSLIAAAAATKAFQLQLKGEVAHANLAGKKDPCDTPLW